MSIEYCQNFRRAFTKDNREVAFCVSKSGKASDQQCGGYSDACKFPKEFIPSRDIAKEKIIFQ